MCLCLFVWSVIETICYCVLVVNYTMSSPCSIVYPHAYCEVLSFCSLHCPRLANLTGNIHRHQFRSSCDCFWHPQFANILTREVLYFRNCALSSDYADLSPRIRGCCVLEVLPRLILRRSQPCNRNTTSTKIIPSHASSQQQSGILQFFV